MSRLAEGSLHVTATAFGRSSLKGRRAPEGSLHVEGGWLIASLAGSLLAEFDWLFVRVCVCLLMRFSEQRLVERD